MAGRLMPKSRAISVTVIPRRLMQRVAFSAKLRVVRDFSAIVTMPPMMNAPNRHVKFFLPFLIGYATFGKQGEVR